MYIIGSYVSFRSQTLFRSPLEFVVVADDSLPSEYRQKRKSRYF